MPGPPTASTRSRSRSYEQKADDSDVNVTTGNQQNNSRRSQNLVLDNHVEERNRAMRSASQSITSLDAERSGVTGTNTDALASRASHPQGIDDVMRLAGHLAQHDSGARRRARGSTDITLSHDERYDVLRIEPDPDEAEKLYKEAIEVAGKVEDLQDEKDSFNHYSDARNLFRQAALKGNNNAQRSLAYYMEHGLDGPMEPENALVWYTKAAEGGNVDAHRNIASMLMHMNTPQHSSKAIIFHLFAAVLAGDKDADKILGKKVESILNAGKAKKATNADKSLLAYAYATGVVSNRKQPEIAYRYLLLAAREGYIEASYRLGRMFLDGTAAKNKNIDELTCQDAAIKYLQYEAEDAYDHDAIPLKVSHEEPPDVKRYPLKYARLSKVIRESTENKDDQNMSPQEQLLLGYMHLRGIGTDQNDKRACELLELARQNGQISADAAYQMALVYQNRLPNGRENGAPTDNASADNASADDGDTALDWMQKAAQLGDARALGLMSRYYLTNSDAPDSSLEEKAKCVVRADHAGAPEAENDFDAYARKAAPNLQLEIGDTYNAGLPAEQNFSPVPADLTKAREWYRRANSNLVPEARTRLEQMCAVNVLDETRFRLIAGDSAGIGKFESRRYEALMTALGEFHQYVICDEPYKPSRLAAEAPLNLDQKRERVNALDKKADEFVDYCKQKMGQYDIGSNEERLYRQRILAAEALKEGLKRTVWHLDAEAESDSGYYTPYPDNSGSDYDSEATNKGDYEEADNLSADPKARAEAQYRLGDNYYRGIGVAQNYDKAREYFEKADNNGADPKIAARAQFLLGYIYYQGRGVAQDYDKAREYFEKADHNGADPEVAARAQFCLGNIYYQGHGVAQSYDTACEYFEKAAKCRVPGLNIQERARDMMNRVRANAFVDAWFNGDDNIETEEQQIAGNGDDELHYQIYQAYLSGGDIGQIDKGEAAKWLALAAQGGNEAAIAALNSLEDNIADKSTAELCYFLYEAYKKGGNGLYKNPYRAMRWLIAAQNDHGPSKARLRRIKNGNDRNLQFAAAQIYQHGVGSIDQNLGEAEEWSKLAKDNGHPQAAKKLKDILNQQRAAMLYATNSNTADAHLSPRSRKNALKERVHKNDKNPEVSYRLGAHYELRYGVEDSDTDLSEVKRNERLDQKAIDNYQKAAGKQYAAAKYQLALCYLEGRGVERDEQHAIDLLIQSAAVGSDQSDARQVSQQAIQDLKDIKGGKSNHLWSMKFPKLQYQIAEAYRNEAAKAKLKSEVSLAKQLAEKANAFYAAAAENNYAPAQTYLGRDALLNENNIRKDLGRMLAPAAQDNGGSPRISGIGAPAAPAAPQVIATDKAIEYLESASDSGNREASFVLGCYYLALDAADKPTPNTDVEEAKSYLQKATKGSKLDNQDEYHARFNLALVWMMGAKYRAQELRDNGRPTKIHDDPDYKSLISKARYWLAQSNGAFGDHLKEENKNVEDYAKAKNFLEVIQTPQGLLDNYRISALETAPPPSDDE